jgi:antitoxin component of MazEF toxin-antitoxin module
MTKTITKVGNSQGIIFDAALMDLARLKVGDQVNVTFHEGGSIILTGSPDHCCRNSSGSSETFDQEEFRSF